MFGWIAAQVAFFGAMGAMRHRPDLGAAFGSWEPLFDVLLSVIVGTYGGWLAARSAFPHRLPRRVEIGVGIAGCLLLAGLYLSASPSVPTPFPAFVSGGVGCFAMSFVLGMVPWGGLVWILSRGAPLRPGQAGAIAGAASLLLSAASMRTMCAVDDRLHLLVWHWTPVAVATAASAGLALRWFRRRMRA